MADRVRFTRGRGRLGSKRLTSWFPIDLTSTLVSASGTILNSLTVPEKAKRPFTIVRTYLEVQQQSDQAIASEQQVGAIGLAVVSDQAAAIGVTAVPTPLTDLDSDLWFMHQLIFGNFLLASAIGFEEGGATRMSLDSKAMRKVNDAEDVVIVAERDAVLGEGTIMLVGGRLLIKEH